MDLDKLIQSKVDADQIIKKQLKDEPCISFDKVNNAFYVTIKFRGRNIVRKRFRSLEDAIKVRNEGLMIVTELSKQLDANNNIKEDYIGNLVKVHRILKGLTLQGLADLVGVTKTTIYKIESYGSVPSLLIAFEIAEVFEKKINDIFIFDSKNKNVATDISGKRFGKLIALYPTTKRTKNKAVYWHCVCDCGKEIDIPRPNLIQGNYVSCGCVNKKNRDNFKNILKEIQEENCINGTNLLTHNQKVSKNSSTKVKGVSPMYHKGEFQCYRAYITYKRKQYGRSGFPTIEEAARYRKKLEEKYFGKNDKEIEE
ncbi:helix-turn-helix transcriptional regulator [Enterococcus ureasiticus]|uniref:helix-turn-helix transcriptional regulator n=1 Tax=Enterococcus ureasiticus TaxID=903984 RepID=UPI001A8E36B8|nr:helix-turn-helix transcriptional regulator [Enterococcus ureasiticus]MBO0474842.1 helix-turn-helix transcriptional regulator [Enterococcus ureasiticus]